MTLLTTTYCTVANLQRFMSAAGVVAFADQDNDGLSDDGVTDDAINQATEEIDAYARQMYDQTGLASSTLINRWATTLAAYFLTILRGNPPPESWAAEFERIIGLLAKVADGAYKLPGVALRGDMRPSWSNVRVDRRFIQTKIRVEANSSTDAPTLLKQNKAAEFPSTFYP